jgi:hypothetical protein
VLRHGRRDRTGSGWLAGLLATVQADANLAPSAIAGILWTAVSPAAAFPFRRDAAAGRLPQLSRAGVPSPARHSDRACKADQADLLRAGPFTRRTKITGKIVRPRCAASADLDSDLP